jgi:hypothetical protein
VTEADAALLVADDDESCKAEATAALDDLGDAVDVDELVHEFTIALFPIAAAVASACAFRSLAGRVFQSRKLSLGGHLGPFKSCNFRKCNFSRKSLRSSQPPSRAASASALTRP